MKYFSTLLFLFFAAGSSYAQSYIPFPDSNAVWTERHGNSEAPPTIYTYGLKNSDTVLNGITYHKLYFSADSVLDDNEFWAGLRQDVAAKKVYLCTPGSPEKLVFDFSLQVGDMFNGNLQVTYIDSVLAGGVYRKRFSFTQVPTGIPMSDQWLEGIGNSDVASVFSYPAMQPTCDCGNSVLCMGQNGQWIYHNLHYGSSDCYKPTLAINEWPVSQPLVQLYPNPMIAGTGHISLSNKHNFSTLEIYSVDGRKVYACNVTGKTDIPLDGNYFKAGIYCYRLSGNGNEYAARFVVE